MTPMPIINIITPVFNEEGNIPRFYQRLAKALDTEAIHWELLFVDDGSTDGSAAEIQELVTKDDRVRYLQLSRNFGQEPAVSAGIDHSHGDALVLIDADLQDPPEIIPEMLAKWRQGYHVIYGTRRSRRGESKLKLLTAKLFYRLINRITDIDIPLDSGMFRLLDRRVVIALQQMPERHRFLRGMTVWVGFRQTGVLFDRDERTVGVTKYSMRAMLRLSLDAITGFSFFPLQLMLYTSLMLAAFSIFLIPIIFLSRILLGPGFFGGQATSIVLILLLSSAQLFYLFILGQYLGRIFDEVRQRPLYLIQNQGNSAEKEPGVAAAIASRSKKE